MLVELHGHGQLRVYAIDGERCAAIHEEHPGAAVQLACGVVISIEGMTSGPPWSAEDSYVQAIAIEAVQAIAIGLAGNDGWVLAPTGRWYDVAHQVWSG